MAPRGRKLLPLDDPVTPTQRFAWLVRAIRSCHNNPTVRDTNRFTQELNRFLKEGLKPATVNRLETGLLEFTIERCSAYEQALGLPDNGLVDVYTWLLRRSGQTPRTELARSNGPDSHDLELVYRLGRGEAILPLEWVRLSYFYQKQRDLFNESPRLRRDLFERLVQDLGSSFEKNQRLLHEAVLIIGDDLAPCIVEFALREPVRYFVAVEALGLMRGPKSWHALLGLHERMIDPFTVHALLESVTRRVQLDRTLGVHNTYDHRILRQYSVRVLQQSDEFFMAREAAYRFLQDFKIDLSEIDKKRLSDYRDDLLQLRVIPSTFKREDLVRQITATFRAELADSRESEDIPTVVPGMDVILRSGIFASDRQERMTMGILLAPWVQAPALTTAIGKTLTLVPSEDYGTQRSMLRFATKISSANLYLYLRRLSERGTRDENTRLSLAWALGMGHEPSDLAVLESIYRSTTSRETKRVVCTAAFRRGFSSLLEEISLDSSGDVSREALLSLTALSK